MIGFPFDSKVTFDANNIPQFDRAISSEPYRALMRSLFTDGVDTRDPSALLVPRTGNKEVTVSPGFCMLNGMLKLQEDPVVINVPPVEASLGQWASRNDYVVMRLNNLESVRTCEIDLLQGEVHIPSEETPDPTWPTLTRNDVIYEIALASIHTSYEWGMQNPVDTRYNDELCGRLTAKVYVNVDSALDTESTNPVQNKVITQKLGDFNIKMLDFDVERRILYLTNIEEENLLVERG